MKPSPATRAAQTNGKRQFGYDVDLRSTGARRFKDLVGDFTYELGRAQVLPATVQQAQMIRRCAAVCVAAERHEAALAKGAAGDSDSIIRLSSELRRLLANLGIGGNPDKVAPKGTATTLEQLFDMGSDEPKPASAYAARVAVTDPDEDEDEYDGDVHDSEAELAVPDDDYRANLAGKAKQKQSRIKRRKVRACPNIGSR